MPRATASSISSGVPTPIRYLGRSCGRIGATSSIMASITDCGSPPSEPSAAGPGEPLFNRSARAGWGEFRHVAALSDAEQHVSRSRGLEGALAALGPPQREVHRTL